jgi:HEAT repeat protein
VEFAARRTASAQARQSIAELVALLESPNRDVAIGTARALAALKAKSALPAPVDLRARDDPAPKAAVQRAIARIGE